MALGVRESPGFGIQLSQETVDFDEGEWLAWVCGQGEGLIGITACGRSITGQLVVSRPEDLSLCSARHRGIPREPAVICVEPFLGSWKVGLVKFDLGSEALQFVSTKKDTVTRCRIWSIWKQLVYQCCCQAHLSLAVSEYRENSSTVVPPVAVIRAVSRLAGLACSLPGAADEQVRHLWHIYWRRGSRQPFNPCPGGLRHRREPSPLFKSVSSIRQRERHEVEHGVGSDHVMMIHLLKGSPSNRKGFVRFLYGPQQSVRDSQTRPSHGKLSHIGSEPLVLARQVYCLLYSAHTGEHLDVRSPPVFHAEMRRRYLIWNIFRKPTTAVDPLKRACHLVEPLTNVAEVNVRVATREAAIIASCSSPISYANWAACSA